MFSVSGTGKSRIEGYTEIVGDSAHLMVANLNGIYISGAGFINVPSLGLTTGTMTDENGQILSDINRGRIEFGVHGMDLSGVDYAAILSRSYHQAGAITNANKVDIIVGSNTVRAGENQSVLEESQEKVTALDAVRLGSIYANTIFVKSTDQGVGVNSEGVLFAENGELELSANGDLVYNDLIAKNDITVSTAHNLESKGSTYSETGAVDISADHVVLTGESSDQIVGSQVNVRARQVESDTVTMSGETVELDVDTLQSSDQLIIANDIQVHGDVSLTFDNTELIAYKQLELQSNGELVAVESSLRADGLSLRAESIEFETFSEANNNLNISSESLHSDDESVMMSSTTVIETGVLKNDGEIVAENIELEARDRVENTGKIIADRIPPLTVESGW